MSARWRKVGKAYRLTDEYSTLWVKRYGSRWLLLHWTRTGMAEMGTYKTLKEAQAEGALLMDVPAGTGR